MIPRLPHFRLSLALSFALSACSVPDAPMPAPVAVPAPAPAPAPVAAPAMPADMPMAGDAADQKHEGEEAEGADLPPTVIPDTAAGIVTAMKEKRTAIQTLIDAGKLKDIHPVAKQLMDLATALPGRSASLASADKGTVALKCVDINEKADEMHDKADDGDAAGTKAAFALVSADLDAIAAVAK